MASNSKPSVPSKTGQWLQEVAHHGSTSKLSLQGCSGVQIMQLNLDKAPTRLSSTHEMVGGVTKVPSRLSSTLEMVDGLSKMVGLLVGSARIPRSRLACEQCGADSALPLHILLVCLMPSCLLLSGYCDSTVLKKSVPPLPSDTMRSWESRHDPRAG